MEIKQTRYCQENLKL